MQIKGRESCGVETAVLNKVVRDPTEKVAFQKRPERNEQMVWLAEGRGFPGRRDLPCRSPEVSACWAIWGSGRRLACPQGNGRMCC